ncbi:MAG: phage portal protein [Desulfovibrionaceae bacterium CG1_02_65_16]|nr:MAG: phage portal protein [Desulfovibrionaceae bacterium CG1_02_65_16]
MKWPFAKRQVEASIERAPIPNVESMRESLEPQNSFSEWGGLSADTWFDIIGEGASASGQLVNADTTMRISAVFACVSLISGAMSSSPLKTYKGTDSGRQLAEDHNLAHILRLQPNRFMTASTFWMMLGAHKLLLGNAYANIIRNRMGKPIALYPCQPQNVSVYFAWEMGLDAKLGVERNRLFYGVTFPDGTYRLYDQDDMLHIPNVPSGDGKKGMSTVRAMANTAGLAMSSEESASKFFSQGMQFDKVITSSKALSDTAKQNLRESYSLKHAGSRNAHIPPILTEGLDIKAISMSAADAQLLDSRKFSVPEICRFFGVPPVMIGETEKTSSWGSGVEQMARWFAQFTMNKHFMAIEQELSVKLFRGDGCFAEFDESELLRGDTKTRADYFKSALGSLQQPAWMTINEVRAAEGLPKLDDGDTLQKPVLKVDSTGKGGSNAEPTDAPAA